MTPEQEKQAEEAFTQRYMIVKQAAAEYLMECQVPEADAHKIAEELINEQLTAEAQQAQATPAKAEPTKTASTRQYKWHNKQAAARTALAR